MATMKMLIMLLVAAILFCSHQQAVVAREVDVVVANDGNELQDWPWEMPDWWNCHWSIGDWYPFPCPPPPPPPPPSPPSPPPPTPFPGCSASDKEKVYRCMFNETLIDPCCPTFKNILGTSCPCYKYAEDLSNELLITLEAYCDVDSPCKGVQVIKRATQG